MKKLVISLAFFMTLASTQLMAFSKDELVDNSKLAQPSQLDQFSRTQLVNRYVLSEHSDIAYHNIIRSVIRDLGSDNSKRVHIIWNDKQSKQNATKIHNFLIKKGIEAKYIKIIRNQSKRVIYPLYIEVAKIGSKKTRCVVDTAEDMMSWDGINPCATKSNHRIQLKH
ncbi:MAG: protein RcpB [Pasteurella oralis]|uniref:protein RcpB n=1 Tax=Pasteurella oralis TaxID=1071947 RepID=UPI00270B8AAD|nr:protein RcpB [Pasteurella oralis]